MLRTGKPRPVFEERTSERIGERGCKSLPK